MSSESKPWVIACPDCGETYWKRSERRIVEDVATVETDTPSAEAVFFDFDDEETQQTEAIGPFKCANGHVASKIIAERLEAIR